MAHLERVIVLVDMDAFYCQVEEKLDFNLFGKPIAVVQYNAWKGGGIIAVNYPARDQGVTRHMRGDEAKEKCPEINLVRVPNIRGKADLTKYREAGKRVAEVLQTFTPLLERASIDEAYLDITYEVNKRITDEQLNLSVDTLKSTHVVGWETSDFINELYSSGLSDEQNVRLAVGGVITEEIRAAVYDKTGYKCSAGIAHNKILAKLSCGLHKPNQQTILPHDNVEELYKTLPVRKIKSLGGKFGNALSEKLGIKFMGELAKFSEKELLQKYDDKTAHWLYNIARGIDMEPVTIKLISKSIGCCKRFPGMNALRDTENVNHWLQELSEEMSERLEQDYEENNRKGKQMIISFAQEVRGKDIHSSRTTVLNSYESKRIQQDAYDVLKKHCLRPDGTFHIKFLGISVGKFEDCRNYNDISLFFLNGSNTKSEDSKKVNNSGEAVGKAFATKSTKPNDLLSFLKFGENNTKNKQSEGEKRDQLDDISVTCTNKDEPTESKSTSKPNNILELFCRKVNKETPAKSSKTNNIIEFTGNDDDFRYTGDALIKENYISLKVDDVDKEDNESIGSGSTILLSPTQWKDRPLYKEFYDTETGLALDTQQIEDRNSIMPLHQNQMINENLELKREANGASKLEDPMYLDEDSISNEIFSSNPDIVHDSSSSSPVVGSFFKSYLGNITDREGHPKRDFDTSRNLFEILESDDETSRPQSEDSNEDIELLHSTLTDLVNTQKDNDSIEDNIVETREILEDSNSRNSSTSAISSETVCNQEPALKEKCSKCHKLILKSEMQSHMDYHFALDIVREESSLYKQESKPKDKPINGVKKSNKRKNCDDTKPSSSSLFKSFFSNNMNDSLMEDERSELCTDCNKKVKVDDFVSHMDFHAAKKLHLEINIVKPIPIPSQEVKSISKKKSDTKGGNSKHRSVLSFFKQK